MIYLIIFIICFFCAYYYDIAVAAKYPHRIFRNSAYILIGILFVILAGLRSEYIGMDTMQYYEDFQECPELGDLDSSVFEASRFQPLWLYYMAIFKTFGWHFNALLTVEAIFVNFVILRFFWKYTKIPYMCAFIFFISPNFIEFNTEIMREAFAISFCLLAFENYLKKRYVIAILLWIVAYNFHVSSLIALFFPLFAMVKYKKRMLVGAVIVALLIMSVFPMISKYSTELSMFMGGLSSKYFDLFDFYYNTTLDTSRNANYYIILFGTKLVLPLLMIAYLKSDSNKTIGFVFVYMLMQILSAYSEAFYRFSNYESLFYVILVATFIYKFALKSCGSHLMRIAFFISITLVFLYIFQSMQFVTELGQSNYRYERYFPYKFFFDRY